MKRTRQVFCLRSSVKDGQFAALAAFKQVDQVVVREGRGKTREDAIAQSIGRRRLFYGHPDVERDLVVAEFRGCGIMLTAEGEFLHHTAG